ncbi:MAG TPA: tetratricopeptide repeat protein, partial [Chloroflexota bacterium]|nr:tetratricopeptide repeat protein [Chloroflexota bacterium]
MGALPVTLTPLVGRGQEIGAALGMLRAGQRLLTLTGPPGVGKTRLAIAIAGQASDLFPDGMQFVSLAPIGDAALAPPLVASAFGAVGDGISGMAAVIGAHLGAERVLLVLDNFEHIPAAAPFVADLLAACPGLSVLATSRGPLRLSGEQLLPVPALSLPGAAEGGPRSEAVELFVARARSVCGVFDLTDRNYASVAAICRRLDGLPLAIELAAARLRVLPPQALLERLQQGLQLLSGSVHDAPARQRAMHDAIAWSYDLLGPPEQMLFRRLAVFAGGWTVEAVQAVCQPDLPLDPLESLSSLLDQSLIRRAEQPDDEPRFEMLHVVREFALDRLAAAGEETEAWRAHARYLRQLGQEFGSARGPEQKRLIGRVEAELNNIRAVLAWALAHASEPEDLEGALELMGSLWFFWIHHRAPREARRWLTRGLAAAPPGRSAPRARALLALGSLEWRQADYAAARDHIEQSADIMREIGDVGGLADTSHFAGHVLFDARDFAGAQRLYETSRAAFEQSGDVVGALPLIGDLGMVAYHQGDYATAQAWFGECLERCREHGAVTFAAESLNRLGDLARLAGDLDRAEALYTESQALEQSINSAPGLASARHKLAQVARRKGKTTEARGLLEEALAMQREMGNKQGILECLV